MLSFEKLDIIRDGRTVVRAMSLSIPSPGIAWIVGPGGAGKSTLLSALAENKEGSQISMSGRCVFNGEVLASQRGRIVFVSQHARLETDLDLRVEPLTSNGLDVGAVLDEHGGFGIDHRDPSLTQGQRRFLAVMAGLHAPGDIHLFDEPTAGLDESQKARVRDRLRVLVRQSTVMAVTHNRQDCLRVGGVCALLAGGEIHEVAQADDFFNRPSTQAGRLYAETGNCAIAPSPSEQRQENGIWWLVPGLLCGMSRPGLVNDAITQYRTLAESGVGLLLNLEERCHYERAALSDFGLAFHHVAIPDMAPPSFAQGVDICRQTEPLIRDNVGVAVHCRGGLGRTGTVMAMIQIWFGDTAEAAISKVRGACLRAIQTQAQERFLHDFADRIRGWH